MEMNQDTLNALLDAFDASDWQEMVVTIGADRLHVSRDALTMPSEDPPAPSAPPIPSPAEAAAPASAPPTPPAARPVPPRPASEGQPPAAAAGIPITAPSVGLFWRSPAPGSPPFVEVGDRVSDGDTVGIVEVMKLMNYVTATTSGVVTAVPVANGETVEFGQALVVVDPEG
jgi:acetyl-CoA carboxylase biotin carboxyl carrier protein